MRRLVFSALVAAAIALSPVALSIPSADQAWAEATSGKVGPGKRKRSDLTKGQKAHRERDRECRRQFDEGKKTGKIERGVSRAKFVSECNVRLKAKSG